MLRLCLKNYQSWAKAHVDVEGLTVLVGSSSLGKSGIGRALKRCLRNDIPTDHIKLGTPKTEIDLEWQGLTIHAERGAKAKDSTVYRIGSNTYEKLGGAVPEEIQGLSLGPIDVNGISIDPCFSGQFDRQFMVGFSPSELNAVLKAFASTEKLDKGRKVLGQRITEINANAKALTPVISGLEEHEHALEEKLSVGDAAVAVTQALLTRVQRLTKAKEAVTRAATASARVQVVRPQVQQIDAVGALLAQALRSFRALEAGRRRIAADRLRTDLWLQAAWAGAQIEEFQGIMDHVAHLSRTLQASSTLGTCRRTLQANTTKVRALRGIPDALEGALRRYKALVRTNSYLAADPTPRKQLIRDIHEINFAPAESRLRAGIMSCRALVALQQVVALASQVAQVSEDVTKAVCEASDIERSLEAARRAKTVLTCPKCGHEFTLEHQEQHS